MLLRAIKIDPKITFSSFSMLSNGHACKLRAVIQGLQNKLGSENFDMFIKTCKRVHVFKEVKKKNIKSQNWLRDAVSSEVQVVIKLKTELG